MSNILPSIRGGRTQIVYPFVRRVRFSTSLAIAANGTEQRAASRGVPLFEGTINWPNITKTERDSINTFFQTVRGSAQQWQMTVLGQTYLNLQFMQDVLQWKETKPMLYSASANWRQLNNAGYTIPTPGSSVPTLASGAFTQLPYERDDRQLSTGNNQPTGWSENYSWYGGGLSGFPTGSMRRWSVGGPNLSDADAVALENDFVGRLGMYGVVSLTDPEDSSVHPTCRYASDVLEITYSGYRQTQILALIEETNG